MKRSFNGDSSSCLEKKRHRGKYLQYCFKCIRFSYCKISSFKVINRLENLSNEVFYEIFDYLDGYDMLMAFSNLNRRFQTLTNHSSIPFKGISDRSTSMSMKSFCDEIIRPNQNRLFSLYLNPMSEWDASCLFDFFNFDASFARLECLILGQVSIAPLLMICSQLKLLPRLYSLKVNVTEEQELSPRFDLVYYAVFSLPVLKSFSITAQNNGLIETLVIVSLTTRHIDQKSSSIKDLTIEHSVTGENLLSLLEYLPEIRHLKCHHLTLFNRIDPRFNEINFSHLKQISIGICSLGFYRFERLMQTIGQTVEILQIERCYMNGYLRAAQWKPLIENYLPRLKVFDMKYQRYRRFQIALRSDLIIAFTSQFWIEHGWFTSVQYNGSLMKFHIHPYK